MKQLVAELAKLPKKPGVFLVKNASEAVVFISKSDNIRQQVLHIISDHTSKRNIMLRKHMAAIDFEIIENTLDATRRELELIQEHHPPLNGRKKGVKQYRFVSLSMKETYPRARKSKTMNDEDLKYLGPFPKSRHIQRAISVAANYYKIADCGKEVELGDTHKIVETCIRRQTKQCMRPCEVEVDVDHYREAVSDFINFFDQSNDDLITELKHKMEEAAAAQEFEKASKIRDDLEAIKKIF